MHSGQQPMLQPALREDIGVSLQGVGLEAHLPPQPSSGRSGSRKKVKRVRAERGGLLFTHHGVSGPAVLDMSHHAVMALQNGHPKPGKRLSHIMLAWLAVPSDNILAQLQQQANGGWPSHL